ncbi:hypothetical protein Tco_0714700, partial [Tanacetum coccineum]
KDATLPIVLRFENGKERAKYILEHGEETGKYEKLVMRTRVK